MSLISMVQRDLQIAMMKIRWHFRIKTASCQSGGRDLEKLLVFMPGICPADEQDGQEQNDANLGKIFSLKPANDHLHTVRRERRS